MAVQQHAGKSRAGSAVGAFAVALLCLFGANPGEARQQRERPHAGASAAEGVSMDQAIAAAERRYKARVVRAETRDSDGGRVYVLRLLSEEGRVWTIRVDAATGAEK